MFKFIFLIGMICSPALAADGFSTDAEYQGDFDKSRHCGYLDGRHVWAGKSAYYIQAWVFQTGQSGLLDDETASSIPISENSYTVLEPFRSVCGQ